MRISARAMIAACGWLMTGPAFAGAWTDNAGQGEIIVTLRGSVATSQFGHAGGLVPAPRFNKEEFDVYGTYGLVDGTTLVFHPILTRIESAGDAKFGLDRTELGLKQRLWSGKEAVLSVQGSVLVPGSIDGVSGGWGGELRALYGWNFQFAGKPAYGNLEMAYRAFEGGQEIRPELTLGWRPNEHWMLLAQSLNTLTVRSDSGAPSHQAKLQASAVRKLTGKLSWQFGIGATVWGENTPAERYGFTGLWLKL